MMDGRERGAVHLAVHRVGRTKAMFKGGSGSNVSQFGLHHRTQIAGGMVPEFDNLARLALKNDHHASSNLGCRNCHKTEVSVDRGTHFAKCKVRSLTRLLRRCLVAESANEGAASGA